MLTGIFGLAPEVIADEAYLLGIAVMELAGRADAVGLADLSYILRIAAQEADDQAGAAKVRARKYRLSELS
jgi:hypothetical protein